MFFLFFRKIKRKRNKLQEKKKARRRRGSLILCLSKNTAFPLFTLSHHRYSFHSFFNSLSSLSLSFSSVVLFSEKTNPWIYESLSSSLSPPPSFPISQFPSSSSKFRVLIPPQICFPSFFIFPSPFSSYPFHFSLTHLLFSSISSIFSSFSLFFPFNNNNVVSASRSDL